MGVPQSTIDAYEAAKVEQPEWTAADQEQLQKDRPPPIKAVVINRQSGAVVGVIPWAARRAASRSGDRPSRPGRTRTIRRQAHSRSTSRRGPPADDDGPEPPPAAQPQRPGDEQDRGTYTSRPRRTRGELVHVWTLLLPVLDRLIEQAEEVPS